MKRKIFFVLPKRLEMYRMGASLEPDVNLVLGSEKGPFHRVVGLPVVFGSPGDFLLGGTLSKYILKRALKKKG